MYNDIQFFIFLLKLIALVNMVYVMRCHVNLEEGVTTMLKVQRICVSVSLTVRPSGKEPCFNPLLHIYNAYTLFSFQNQAAWWHTVLHCTKVWVGALSYNKKTCNFFCMNFFLYLSYDEILQDVFFRNPPPKQNGHCITIYVFYEPYSFLMQ